MIPGFGRSEVVIIYPDPWLVHMILMILLEMQCSVAVLPPTARASRGTAATSLRPMFSLGCWGMGLGMG